MPSLKIDANRFADKTVCICFKFWRFTKVQIMTVLKTVVFFHPANFEK